MKNFDSKIVYKFSKDLRIKLKNIFNTKITN